VAVIDAANIPEDVTYTVEDQDLQATTCCPSLAKGVVCSRAALICTMDRMKNLLEQDSTIWQLKDVVRRQFCSDM
jgi:hypothetical protein